MNAIKRQILCIIILFAFNSFEFTAFSQTITSATNNFHVSIGSTLQLTGTPTGGSWTSNATGIATVNTSGLVTGVAKGTATISYGAASVGITVDNPVINYLYTNYNPTTHINNGFWQSGVGNLNISDPAPPSNINTPDNTHELLAFKFNDVLYSTSVSDSTLNAHSIAYTSGKYKALPVEEISNISGANVFFGFGDRVDGVVYQGGSTEAFASKGPFPRPPKLAYILNSGKQGLNLGSVITNIPSSIKLKFEVLGIKDPNVVGDGVPEILITQMAQPSGSLDSVYFVNAINQVVGKKLTIDFTSNTATPSLGNLHVNFYDPSSGDRWLTQGTSWSDGGRLRTTRLWARDAADFGITAANANDIKALIYRMGGSSDPAFLAYNANFLFLIGAVDDYASTIMNRPVSIPILNNDDFDNSAPAAGGRTTYITIVTGPKNGTGIIENVTDDSGNNRVTTSTVIKYTPNTNYLGKDSILYRISLLTDKK